MRGSPVVVKTNIDWHFTERRNSPRYDLCEDVGSFNPWKSLGGISRSMGDNFCQLRLLLADAI